MKKQLKIFEDMILKLEHVEDENRELKKRLKNIEDYCFECNETINKLIDENKKNKKDKQIIIIREKFEK